jgi:HEAT repeat protein
MFAPNGKTLFSSCNDCTILEWNVSLPNKTHAGAILTESQFSDAWAHLAKDDSKAAYRTLWSLVEAKNSISFLEKNLRPIQEPNYKRIDSVILDLNNNDFLIRESAMKELEKLGEIAEPSLRRALMESSSAESKRRLTVLLDDITNHEMPPADETLRGLRSIEILERIGTPQAIQLMSRLSKGAQRGRLTQEAKASLKRMTR